MEKLLKISKSISIILMIIFLVIIQFQNLKKNMIEKDLFTSFLQEGALEPKTNEELEKYYYVCENVTVKGENKEYCNQIENLS